MDRQDWAKAHADRITALLDTSMHREVPQRLWRLRFWNHEDEYTLVTLVQNINVPSAPNQHVPKVQVNVVRPYWRISAGTSLIHLNLFGVYDVHDIVAFLALDTIDPDTVEWIDQTRYSDIVVVGDVLRRLRD